MVNNVSNNNELYVLLFSTTAFFLLLAGFIIYFIILYQKKQVQNKMEQEGIQSAFRQELLKAQIEIQEQTLTHISREIHDNITQVLSFVKLTLATTGKLNEADKQLKINESRDLVAQAINELRDLSKSLSFEHITSLGLAKTIQIEVDRVNKSGLINATLLFEGDVYTLGEQRELVLFRIFQEGLNNTLKYSGAKLLKISLQYHSELFNLTLEDNGSGFSRTSLDKNKGLGLKNMENRAVLIGAAATIDSSPGKGCCIKVTLNPLKRGLYIDGTHSDRFG